MNNKIRAVVVDPSITGRLTFQEVDLPKPAANEALIKVASVSLNRGELRRAANAQAGCSGPPQGTRVVGFLPSGAWAEFVSVPTNALAELPHFVSFTQAATLPVAGLTAYHVLNKGGFLLNRPV